MCARPFHNRDKNTKVKIKLALGGLWLHLARRKYAQNFRPIGHPGNGGSGFCLGTMRCSLRAPRGEVGAGYTSLTPAGWRRPGGDRGITPADVFIELSFNACLKVTFLQNRRTPVPNIWAGQVFKGDIFVLEVEAPFRDLTMVLCWVGMAPLKA